MRQIIVNADGGSRGNPGPAAIGIVIRDDKRKVLETYKERIGAATNNTAEYKSLIKALELASKHTKEELRVFMDSELVIRQLTGAYRVKAKLILPLYQQAKKLEALFQKVSYANVPREDSHQAQADQLVNDALDHR
jgi:ribonuclease HI